MARLVNTHCHSDHIGGNATIKAHYRCPIALPEAEAPLIDRWDEMALLLGYCDQRTDRFGYDEVIRPGETHVWGGLEWRALAAPGHDMAALVFHNPEHGILISGDALWENGYGLVMPLEIDPRAMPATRATLDMLAGLDVGIVIPGHGAPFTDVAAALERAYQRTAAFEASSLRVAKYALKALRVSPCSTKDAAAGRNAGACRAPRSSPTNQRFQLAPEALAEMLIAELERAGAARREQGWLLAA